MAYRGDLIACEVDFKGVRKDRVSVLFSLNGKEVGRSSVKYTSGQLLYPLVSLGFPGNKVLAKVCPKEGEGEGGGGGWWWARNLSCIWFGFVSDMLT